MNDEIKLKDMIDFFENVYKDIKKQPTLKEELEKERKFINKIKGDNKDEVKELLEHIEILDNTDYILHSDKAKTLLDYITNLQEEKEDYKSRNEKAIELINKRIEEEDNGIGWVEMRTEEYFEECDEVINILNGGDEE